MTTPTPTPHAGRRVIRVLHGPNLNLLGPRQPLIYGSRTLAEIDAAVVALGDALGVRVVTSQHNGEGDYVDAIQAAPGPEVGAVGLILNPAAYTHTSIAIRDALLATALPAVEVHLSNVHAREPFRQHSYFSDIAHGVVAGFGADSYRMALEFILRRLASN